MIEDENVPPSDDAKEDILWSARSHVLHSQNVTMQISWARDVLIWAEISADAAARQASDMARPPTPRIERELRSDALNIIKHLAQQDHPDALYIRSKWLEFGKFGHRLDKREAYNGYRRAAEMGHARSEYRMGMLFEQSNDIGKAKEHYYRGMGLQDSAALYRMGMMSLLGQHGEPKDIARGLERIRAAADRADEDAPQGSYVYGMLVGRDLPDIQLPDGGLPYNLETAKIYVEKAAYLGFAKAQLKMGQAYELCQLGCDFNPTYSLHYYVLAAKQGLPEAALGVSRWFLFGYEDAFKKNEELAFRYAKEAAAARLPTGEFAMGYYHEIGIHVKKSITEARRWYQLAADHGNPDAMGRLESLSQDKSLSKRDHETTTLTRIKSQHGSQRGRRPERFRQPQKMPTLNENNGQATMGEEVAGAVPRVPIRSASSSATASPLASPQFPPSTRQAMPVMEQTVYGEATGVSTVLSDRQPAFNIRLDTGAAPSARPHSVAPYPDDGQPEVLQVNRSRSAVPYPEEEEGGRRGAAAKPSGGVPYRESSSTSRPTSAFGARGQTTGPRPMPTSHSAGSLQQPARPAPRDRVASAGGWEGGRSPGGYRQSSPSSVYSAGRRQANEEAYGGSTNGQGYGVAGVGSSSSGRQQKAPAGHGGATGPGMPSPRLGTAFEQGREYDNRRLGRRSPEALPQQEGPASGDGYERFSKVSGPAGRPERFSSLPAQEGQKWPQGPRTTGAAAAKAYGSGAGRTSSVPTGQVSPGPPSPGLSSSGMPATTKPSKGPATFEDMGIPQGKQEGDCVRRPEIFFFFIFHRGSNG